MRDLEHFDGLGENARRRGEDRRRRKILMKILPGLLCILALMGFAVSWKTALACFFLAFLAFLAGYPGLWLPYLPERVQAPQVVGLYFRSVLRGIEEDHAILTASGDGSRFRDFRQTAYGYCARVKLRELGHLERWQAATTDIEEKFIAFGVEKVTVEEVQTGSGLVEVKLYQRSPLQESHEVDFDD